MTSSKMLISLTILTTFLLLCVEPFPVFSRPLWADFLRTYGYMNSRQDSSEALKRFQEFSGLKVTGKLDKETEDLMSTPRCGVEDTPTLDRYKLIGTRWQKKDLTYRILSYPTNGLRRSYVDAETRKAFNMWQDVSGLTIRQQSFGPADIEIKFVRGYHGSQCGPLNEGVMAHAYGPGGGIGGDAHFNDGKDWSVTPFKGVQVLNTLTHEFGHSLGLSHSRVPGSIMAPAYPGWDPNLRLAYDDIQGIQSLYGKAGFWKEANTTIESEP